jgi:Flp pilus assembly protein TadD
MVNGTGAKFFHSNPNASTALRRLAELMFLQSQLFGQLSVDQGISRGQIQRAIMRVGPVLSLLTVLEQIADLRFDSVRLPFCYNRETWAKDCPAGGYTAGSDAPLPSQVLSSLALSWNLHDSISRTINTSVSDPGWASTGESTNLVERLIRSALAVVMREGFATGLEYLFDLLRAGYIIDTEPLVNAMSILLVARAQTDSDTDMASRFYGGSLPESNEGGINQDIYYDWMRIESLRVNWRNYRSLVDIVDFSIDLSKIAEYIAGILKATLARVGLVREAATFDDWVIGQITLSGEITVATAVISGLVRPVPLAMRAALSQLEEIRADVGGLVNVLKLQCGIPSYYADENLEFVKHVAQQYKRTLGDEWVDRFFAERLLVPRVLRPTLLPDLAIQNKNAEWDALSWLLAEPFCLMLRSQEPAVVISKKSDTSISLERVTEPTVSSFVSRTAGLDLKDVLDTDASNEWVQRVGVSSEVLAIGAMTLWSNFSSGQVTSWKTVVDGLDPKQVEAQHGAVLRQRDNTAVVLSEYSDLCSKEVLAGLESAMQESSAGRIAEAVRILSRLRETYPWNAFVYQELSIATDQNGDPNTALELMLQALVLNPRQSLTWQSLSVILQRLGAQEESRIALATSMAVKQVEELYPLR